MKPQQNRMLNLYNRIQGINEQRHLYSIRTAFISTMPAMIVGAFATAINNLPIPPYQALMQRLFGENWRIFGAIVYNGTTQVVALLVLFAICMNLASWYRNNRGSQVHSAIAGMLGVSSYLILTLPVQNADSIPFPDVGATGLFVAMVVAVLSTEAYVRLIDRTRSGQLLSDDPNVSVPQAFASVGPVALVIVAVAVVRMLLVLFGVPDGLTDLVQRLLSYPFTSLGEGVGTAQLFNIASHVMWLFGIHGNNVLDGVAQSFFVPAMQENIAAAAAGLAPPNLITKTLFDAFVYMGGSGATLALLIALMLVGDSRSYRTLMRYALPTSLFNINEPLIFGIPIVLNPIYAIPFVLTPVAMLTSTTLAMQLGLVPYTIAEVSWATPVLVSGYAATGSWAGVALQLFNLAVAVAIYAPFVRLADRLAQYRFDRAYKDLVALVTSDYSPHRRLVRRSDEIGAVARRLASQLKSALREGQMFLVYQPIVAPKTGTLHSVEALLRWKHPRHGMINPMVTVALAEETGLMDEVGLWVAETALRQRKAWTDAGLPHFHVSVNVSTSQLHRESFHTEIRRLLERHGVPPADLQVEITETVALVENEATGRNLAFLAQLGVTIAMDDFGVGHSSLLYLRTQPITTLKIDGSLSREVVRQPANLEIISTILDLCRLLGVSTIIEYVDNQEQLDLLVSTGATLIQGYYYSPPLPGEEIPGYMQQLAAGEPAQG